MTGPYAAGSPAGGVRVNFLTFHTVPLPHPNI
jgi:hypothetical protein